MHQKLLVDLDPLESSRRSVRVPSWVWRGKPWDRERTQSGGSERQEEREGRRGGKGTTFHSGTFSHFQPPTTQLAQTVNCKMQINWCVASVVASETRESACIRSSVTSNNNVLSSNAASSHPLFSFCCFTKVFCIITLPRSHLWHCVAWSESGKESESSLFTCGYNLTLEVK